MSNVKQELLIQAGVITRKFNVNQPGLGPFFDTEQKAKLFAYYLQDRVDEIPERVQENLINYIHSIRQSTTNFSPDKNSILQKHPLDDRPDLTDIAIKHLMLEYVEEALKKSGELTTEQKIWFGQQKTSLAKEYEQSKEFFSPSPAVMLARLNTLFLQATASPQVTIDSSMSFATPYNPSSGKLTGLKVAGAILGGMAKGVFELFRFVVSATLIILSIVSMLIEVPFRYFASKSTSDKPQENNSTSIELFPNPQFEKDSLSKSDELPQCFDIDDGWAFSLNEPEPETPSSSSLNRDAYAFTHNQNVLKEVKVENPFDGKTETPSHGI